jgi:hypothetical protein
MSGTDQNKTTNNPIITLNLRNRCVSTVNGFVCLRKLDACSKNKLEIHKSDFVPSQDLVQLSTIMPTGIVQLAILLITSRMSA